MAKFDAIGLGSVCVDYLFVLRRYPEIGEKVVIQQYSKQGGGIIGTSMVAMARLGAKVSYIGKVGDDDLGRFTRAELEREGVDLSGLAIEAGAMSPFSYVLIDEETRNRTIFWSMGGVSPLSPLEISREHVISGRFLVLDDYEVEAALAAASWAQEGDTKVVLDAENVAPETEQLIKLCNVLKVSSSFAKEFTGEKEIERASASLRALGPDCVVVTLGEEGSFCLPQGGSFRTLGFQVEVVDTTGAGDVFHGALVYGLLRFNDLEEIVEFSNAVAALKCTKLGGRDGIPTFSEVEAFMRDARAGRL